MAKTFLPTLVQLLRHVCIYIARYELTIRQVLTEEQEEKLDAVMVACSAFTAAVVLVTGD